MCIRDRDRTMKKSRGILVLILTAIVTVFFCYTAAVGIGPTGTGAMKNIKTGLDLAGGVSITYQAKDSNPSSEDMSDTVYKLQKRVEQYSTCLLYTSRMRLGAVMDVSAEEKKADNSTRISMVTACIGTLESKLYSLLFYVLKRIYMIQA